MKELILKLIDEEIGNLQFEMKHLDKQYIEKQKRIRDLKRTKEKVLQTADKQE